MSGPHTRPATQLDGLTGVRFFAAAWVMLLHFRDVTQTRSWHYPLVDRLIVHGNYGVDLFFVLSGFILCHVYADRFATRITRHELRSFISYRFARLYPVHLVTLAAMIVLYLGQRVLTGASGGNPERFTPGVVVSSLTMTHGWWGTVTPNLPAWSISAEWFAYLLFPLLCLALTRARSAPVVFVLVGCGLATVWHAVSGVDPTSKLPGEDLIRVMAGFLVGMATYRLYRRVQGHTRTPALGIVLAVLVIVWACVGERPRLEVGVLLFAGLIIALASERDWLGRALSHRSIVYLGEVSYAIYMVHWVVRVVVRAVAARFGVLDTTPPALMITTYVVVTMITAVSIYHLVELPWRGRLRRMLAPRTTSPARLDAVTLEPAVTPRGVDR